MAENERIERRWKWFTFALLSAAILWAFVLPVAAYFLVPHVLHSIKFESIEWFPVEDVPE